MSQAGANGFDELDGLCGFVARAMIPNDKGAGVSRRSEQTFASCCQADAIHRAVELLCGGCRIKDSGLDEGMSRPAPTGHGFDETIATDGPTTHPSEIAPESPFIKKYEPFRIHLLLRLFPLLLVSRPRWDSLARPSTPTFFNHHFHCRSVGYSLFSGPFHPESLRGSSTVASGSFSQ